MVYVKLPSGITTIPLKDEEENEDDDDASEMDLPPQVNGENKNNIETTNLRRSIRQSLRQKKKKLEYPRIIIKPIQPPPKEGNCYILHIICLGSIHLFHNLVVNDWWKEHIFDPILLQITCTYLRL